jgi:hypothetical protein
VERSAVRLEDDDGLEFVALVPLDGFGGLPDQFARFRRLSQEERRNEDHETDHTFILAIGIRKPVGSAPCSQFKDRSASTFRYC